MSILTINAGSSSLKIGQFDDDAKRRLSEGAFDWSTAPHHAVLTVTHANGNRTESKLGIPDDCDALTHGVRLLIESDILCADIRTSVHAVGHRVVHGGTVFSESVVIDDQTKSAIDRLSQLAPLHNPQALRAINAAQNALPEATQIAVFDTAFFADLAPRAFVYPLPYAWYEDWGIRRFGFHGISHRYCAQRAAELLGHDSDGLRVVTCHLGNGCSATAVKSGEAVATTMGFTPLEGLMMGSRAGSIDPAILLHVQHHHGMDVAQLDHALNHASGLLGVSGVSSDLRQIEAAAKDNTQAQLAMQIYSDRVRSAIGALAVTMGGVDALVFTGGVGQNSPKMRSSACEGLECLGLKLDENKNKRCRTDADIANEQSLGHILVLRTREEFMIAREAHRVMKQA